MDFLQRSYMWKKRIEQKLENQRREKDDLEQTEQVAEASGSINGLDVAVQPVIIQKEASKLPQNQAAVSQELAQFFNLKDDKSMQNRKMKNNYLH